MVMDKPIKPNPLPSIRTLARDMALKSDSKSAPIPQGAILNKAEQKDSTPNFVDKRDKLIYQAPKNIVNPVKPPTEKIPPVVNEIPKQKLKPISGLKKSDEPTIVVDNEEASTSIIISDTKHKRFHLLPAIGFSFKTWLASVKEKYFTKKVSKYTVPDATRRKGVIQRATSKTGKVATFDNTSLQERIRERQNRTVPKAPETIWTANTEPGYLLLESPENAISNVKVVPRKSFRTPPPTPKPVISTPIPVTLPKIQEAPVEAEVKPVIPAVVTPIPTPVVLPELDIPVVEPVISAPPAPAPAPVIEEIAYVPPPEPTISRVQINPSPQMTLLRPTNFKERLFLLNTNFISMTVAGIMLAIVLTIIIGYSYTRTNTEKIEIVTTPNHPVIMDAPLQTVFSTEKDRDALFSKITENQKQSTFPILQLALTNDLEGKELRSPASVFATLRSNVGTVFSQSISALYFGNFEQITPFIALKITDPITAKGGMLAWEETLFKDLQPMLVAFDPSNGEIIDELKFKDITIGKIDVRSLNGEDGREVLVYGITPQNVILITTNQAVLSQLFTLIK